VFSRVICSHVALQEERRNIKESAQWSINFQLGNPVCKPAAVQPNADCLASLLALTIKVTGHHICNQLASATTISCCCSCSMPAGMPHPCNYDAIQACVSFLEPRALLARR
jgi:hypothetical protein